MKNQREENDAKINEIDAFFLSTSNTLATKVLKLCGNTIDNVFGETLGTPLKTVLYCIPFVIQTDNFNIFLAFKNI